ncbi:MAG: glycosyltransferase family 4 protein [Chloroflexi bacterium]|nr:glycosyltransferase family 4 protein [Chloroflexota bacterium]
MKIALVSPYDYPYPGGVTEHVRNLAEQFMRRGHEVHVIAPSSVNPADVSEPPTLHRVGRPMPIPANGSVARITLPLRGYVQVKRLLSYQGFDIVHLHEPMMPALPLTVLRHSQAVNVGTFHAYSRTNTAYFYGKPVLKPLFRRLHGKIAVSGPARDFVADRFPGDYRIIPNGIDYGRFATPMEPLPAYEDDRLDVLFVGRLEKRKGLEYLLRAWPRVQAQFPQARLIVVGGGGRRLESYRRYVSMHGWTSVVFTGYVSADDLVRYYQTADVFCAPSTGQESFGIVLLEAMAAGRPIVASAIRGYAEVMTDGREGLLVPPRDPAALAVAVSRLLADASLRRGMGASGRQTAASYDWSRVADKVLDFYAETIDAHMEDPEVRSGRLIGGLRKIRGSWRVTVGMAARLAR